MRIHDDIPADSYSMYLYEGVVWLLLSDGSDVPPVVRLSAGKSKHFNYTFDTDDYDNSKWFILSDTVNRIIKRGKYLGNLKDICDEVVEKDNNPFV